MSCWMDDFDMVYARPIDDKLRREVEGNSRVIHNPVDMNSPQKAVKSPATLRALGVVLVVLGGILMGGMAVLSWVMYGVINNTDPRASTKFTGSESDMLFMFAIFALVFFIGLTAFTAGLWQVVFGRRNLILVWIMLGLGGIFFIIGTIVRYLD